MGKGSEQTAERGDPSDRAIESPLVRERLAAIRAYYAGENGNAPALAQLFSLYRGLVELVSSQQSAEEHDARLSALHAAKSEVLETACGLPAGNVTALTYKMAIWRWETERETTPDAATRLGHSVFVDLATESRLEHTIPTAA